MANTEQKTSTPRAPVIADNRIDQILMVLLRLESKVDDIENRLGSIETSIKVIQRQQMANDKVNWL